MVEAGGHGLLTFRRQDLIVVSPGVPLDTPELAQVRSFGLPGDRRAGTGRALSQGQDRWPSPAPTAKPPPPPAGRDPARKPDFPRWSAATSACRSSALIDESTDETWSVLEVSSFQLESTEEFHPDIAVILNITPDHLDRHGTFENYALAKERIFAAQDRGRLPGAERRQRARRRGRPRRAPVYWFSIEHAVAQGAWVRGRPRGLSHRPGCAGRNHHAAQRHSAQGRAQRGERAGRGVRRAAGRSARGSHPPRRRELPGRRASAGISSPRSTASSTTTTPRPPTWTPRPRPWPHLPAAFT